MHRREVSADFALQAAQQAVCVSTKSFGAVSAALAGPRGLVRFPHPGSSGVFLQYKVSLRVTNNKGLKHKYHQCGLVAVRGLGQGWNRNNISNTTH